MYFTIRKGTKEKCFKKNMEYIKRFYAFKEDNNCIGELSPIFILFDIFRNYETQNSHSD
jgi:hypothetical protein